MSSDHTTELLSYPWPPRDMPEASSEPLPVPYLDDPPAIITIDTGRQLFVDDFLIEQTTLSRVFVKPELDPANPVLSPETEHELDNGNCPMAAPFNDGICYDPEDNLYKLWYMPGWFHSTAMAISEDGIQWHRPDYDVVPGTNLVWPHHEGADRDGSLVWLDHDAKTRDERFKMFQFYRVTGREGSTSSVGQLHISADGIHWSDPVETTPVGDNTSFFYNPFRKKWCMSVRRSSMKLGNLRARYYHERDDFLDGADWDPAIGEVFWQRCDRYDLPDPARPDHKVALYDLNVTPYESLMLGAFAIFRGPENAICAREGVPKTIDLGLGYSRDGFHFSRPDRTPFIASSRRIGDWNRAYIHAAGGLCTVTDDELQFYFGAFSGESPMLGPGDEGHPGRSRRAMYAGASTGRATLRRDGFAAMKADRSGELTTRSLMFSGDRLFVNVDCPDGELTAEILTEQGDTIPGFERESSVAISADTTRAELRWNTASLGSLSGRATCFRFHLRRGRLFSFWVTDDPGGSSRGYVAAGGPGYRSGRDTLPVRGSAG